MRNITRLELILGAVFTIGCCGAALAQSSTSTTSQSAVSAEEVRFFRLDFVVREIEQGKVITSRSYSTTTSTKGGSDSGSIRAGSRIPIPVSSPSGPEPGGGPNMQYIDVGVNIDCNRVHMKGDELVAVVSAEVSTLAEDARPPMPQGKDQPTKTGPGPGFAGPPDAPEGDVAPEKDMGPSSRPRVIRAQMFRGPGGPVIRQNRWSATAVAPLGKPLTLFFSDDITSKRRMEVEWTATEIR